MVLFVYRFSANEIGKFLSKSDYNPHLINIQRS